MNHSNKGRCVGYIRINALCDDLQKQLIGLDLDLVFQDTIIRKKQLLVDFAKMMDSIREGDTLFVQRMDILARDPEAFLEVVYELTRRGVRIECLNENIIFPAGESSPIRNLILLVISASWNAYRLWTSQRQREAQAYDEPGYWVI